MKTDQQARIESTILIARQMRWMTDHIIGAMEVDDALGVAFYLSQMYRYVTPDGLIGDWCKLSVVEQGTSFREMVESDINVDRYLDDMKASGLWTGVR